VADDLKDTRDAYQQTLDDWATARGARADCMKALAGDPWKFDERQARMDAGRPCVSFDELSQYVNAIVNEVRANPRGVQFAPTGPGTSEQVADFYGDKMREIEYRSHANLAYTTAFESAVQGGYGFVRVTSEFMSDSVDRQELVIKPVMDPNTILPNWGFQRPDLSDMTRCFVLEKRSIAEFRQQFPRAKVQSFEGYEKDESYRGWLDEKNILLVEDWRVTPTMVKLLLVQPPPVAPPPGTFGFRPPQAPAPFTIREDQWHTMPAGSTVLRTREAMVPKVTQQLVNGVEVLSETSWPGPFIPIAGCMGRVLYVDDAGMTNRLLMSAVQLALEPYMAFCFVATSEMEVIGTITKNPYWAYENQLSPDQEAEIAKSLHEPVAVLKAKAVIEGLPGQLAPLPVRNPMALDLSGYAMLREETRRSIQSAMATNFLPTQAQGRNEKSGKALEKIDQARLKGSFHFVDHFEMMLRHVGCICEAAMDTIYDTEREVLVRKADDKTEQVWINSPSRKDALNLKGNYAVTVSSGPSVDSTREAASQFADMLLGSVELMTLLGPEKAQQIAALAVKLKVKQTGIGAIGEQIVDIISPPPDQDLAPEQLAVQNQQLKAQLQQLQQMADQMKQEMESGLAKEREKTQRDVFLTQLEQRFGAMLQEMKGMQKLQEIAATTASKLTLQDDAQAHDLGIHGAEADRADQAAQLAATTALAKPVGGGNGSGASA
jgi:hypothetical protein